MAPLKGLKVTDAGRSRIIGIACSSLSELISKGKIKLNVPKKNKVGVFLSDGTEVDCEEYFHSLPNQSLLILKQDHETLLTGADLFYHTLKYINIDIIRAGEKVKQFLDENIKEKIRILAEVINESRNNNVCKTSLSDKADDPDWFLGLETNAKTKEAFMFRRSQERIRGYFYKTKSDIKKSTMYIDHQESRKVLDQVFADLSKSLNEDKFFGCFFDRSARGALCDPQGYFKCSGVWKSKSCLYTEGKSHIINPYASREERIVFSTWNLDHCVERSRSIIPALMSAAEAVVSGKDDELMVNVPYFYTLLFTSNNLRLVHIVCHDKGKHFSALCDPKKYTIKITCFEKPPSQFESLRSTIAT